MRHPVVIRKWIKLLNGSKYRELNIMELYVHISTYIVKLNMFYFSDLTVIRSQYKFPLVLNRPNEQFWMQEDAKCYNL